MEDGINPTEQTEETLIDFYDLPLCGKGGYNACTECGRESNIGKYTPTQLGISLPVITCADCGHQMRERDSGSRQTSNGSPR